MPALANLLFVGVIERRARQDVVNVPMRAAIFPRHAAFEFRLYVRFQFTPRASNQRIEFA
jgi:hypothetical protein